MNLTNRLAKPSCFQIPIPSVLSYLRLGHLSTKKLSCRTRTPTIFLFAFWKLKSYMYLFEDTIQDVNSDNSWRKLLDQLLYPPDHEPKWCIFHLDTPLRPWVGPRSWARWLLHVSSTKLSPRARSASTTPAMGQSIL